jgi:carbamoyl-phosphate synthase large subunit
MTCLDKWTLIEACRTVVATPRTSLLDDAFDADAWEWPAIVKPRRGSGSRGVAIVGAATALAGVVRDGSMIVQELLPGIEHSIDVLAYRDGRIAAAVPRTRLKVDSGIAVAGCTEPDDALESYARSIARAIGLTSVANVQVKQDRDGQPRLLEVNARFPGSMPLTVAAGVDMPSLALADALGRDVPDAVPFAALAMVRTWCETFMPISEFGVDTYRGGT